MPTILAVSSSIAVGHVGLAAITPAATLAGATVWGLPTVILSNHPAFPEVAGTRVDSETLRAMIDAIETGGWLRDVTTLLIGYLPSPDHVVLAEDLISRVRAAAPAAGVICDPILGDDPKGVYIDTQAAAAIRERLVPKADCLLPNRFELAWLTGADITGPESARRAATSLGSPRVIVTSVPDGHARIANVEVTPDRACLTRHYRLDGVPKGTGDVLSGLIASGWPLARAAAALETLARLSHGRDHLAIVETATHWRTAEAIQPESLE
jgi:pyridoxine kinase